MKDTERVRERERQRNITATTMAIEVLEEAAQLEPSVDLRHPIAVLRNELERLRSGSEAVKA